MTKKSGRPPRSPAEIALMRSKIANHAQRLFRDEGFEAVSIRRLAKEVGCAPMTIYAHFDSKTDILHHLWGDVLDGLFAGINEQLAWVEDPVQRLNIAAQGFVDYWLTQPEHFRLVFMSSDVSRADVGLFMEETRTLRYFAFLSDLIQAALPGQADVKCKADTLVAGMIGIALCLNTIRDHSWSTARSMTSALVAGLLVT